MSEVFVPFAARRRRPAQASPAAEGDLPRRYPARVARQLAMAHALKRRIDDGEFPDQATMARGLGFTRARISQLFDLLLLAPQVQEEVLFLEDAPGKQAVTECDLRPVARLTLWGEQQRAWYELRSRRQATQPGAWLLGSGGGQV